MYGFFNRLLRIDLTAQKFSYEKLSDDILRKTLGGKGLGAYLLLKENPPGVAPFSPQNVFILTPGPLTDTVMWSHSRFAAFTKSPATGGFGESYCGGSLAPRLKGCGVDAIVMTGRVANLSYLVIDENGVSFNDAAQILGAETFVAEEHILNHAPKNARAMVIGPAGENLVACACIKADRWRSLGRGGLGAVLGSKNIKGMAFCGKKVCEVASKERIRDVAQKVAKISKDNPVTTVYQKFGTPNQVKVTNINKCFPTQYWQSGFFPGWEKISADYMQANFEIKPHACPTCFLRCTKHSVVKHGRHAGLEIEGPEFETIYALGGLNCIDSLEEVCWLNDLCDRLGIDTMSAGNLSAFAVEAFKRGKSDFAIDYNQPERVAELFKQIAYRQGLGDILAKGIKTCAKELGLEDIAVHVKGLEPAGFDPRVLKGMGLSYATAARGACHLRGTFYKAELSGQIPKEQIEEKAKLQIDYEDRAALFDCLILCRFFRDFIDWQDLGNLVWGATGIQLTKEQLADLANDVTTWSRQYNWREGLDHTTDTLPPFLFEPNREGATLTEAELQTMINEYNKLRSREL